MDHLLPLAEKVAARLIARQETIAVAEGSAGGLIAAALLAVPGASAYFVGGAVVYTAAARGALAGIAAEEMKGIRPASEPYAALLAQRLRARLNASWALAEAGAAGPRGNRYGDPPGHTCIAIDGPLVRAITLRTGSTDRRANMRAFAARALELFAETIGLP
jgi:nicotinamide-nucleotide amidase